MRPLLDFQMSESCKVGEHVHNFKLTICELDAAGMTFDAPTQTALFLSTLSASSYVFTRNLVARQTSLAFDKIVSFMEAINERRTAVLDVLKAMVYIVKSNPFPVAFNLQARNVVDPIEASFAAMAYMLMIIERINESLRGRVNILR
ncbi:hypothetical protein AMTR_s00001p00272220 [Amborella trichopoda]|uniref:Uncharacterized protein n=1 Tax=Amborella trichopoda TaxID=13333 RepID=W1NMV0_AMBTC|nr:hypothetical protein AMTR_s00001p00272220 [Amborella trichopoda]